MVDSNTLVQLQPDRKEEINFLQVIYTLGNVLNSLPTAADAPFNAYQRQHDPTCLPDTRVDLLREIFNWADRRDEQCIFWLNSLASTGKSTIARLVREQPKQLCDRVDVTSAGPVNTPLS